MTGPRALTRRRLLAAALLSWLLISPAGGSDGPAPSILGARGPVALPAGGDPHTAFRMPSGVGWALQNQVELDLFVAYFRSTAKNQRNDLVKDGIGGAGSLGAVLVPDEDAPFTLHLGLYPELGAISPKPTRVNYTTFPGIGLRADTMFVTAAGSLVYTPTRWLSLGVALQVTPGIMQHRLLLGGSGQQTLDLGGSPRIAGVPLPGDPTYAEFLDLVPSGPPSDPTLVYRASGTALHLNALLSLTLCPTDRLAIGLAWRPRSWAALPFRGEAEIDATATVEAALAGLDPSLRALFMATLPDGGRNGFQARYDMEQEGPYVPQTARLSLAWWPTDELLLAGEVAWTDWHGAFGRSTVVLTGGTNADFNHVVGANRVVVRAPTRWKSQWTASVQVAWRVLPPLTLRAGFHYGESPLNPKLVGSISTPSFASTSAQVGAGWQLTRDVQLNALVEWVFPERRRSGLGTGAPTTEGTRYTSDQVVLHLGVSVWF